MTDRVQAKEVIARFPACRLLVIGDAMLDRYVSGFVDRISPEAPVPVVRVEHDDARPGGAANVALNIQAMGGNAVMGALIGRDSAGEDLLGMLSSSGIDVSACEQDKRLTTTVKTRILADRQQVVRVDREGQGVVEDDIIAAFRQRVAERIDTVHGAIFEDYGKGVITQALIDDLAVRGQAAGIMLGYDPKHHHHLRFPSLTLATPNYMEACDAAALPMASLPEDPLKSEALDSVAQQLQSRWNCEHLMITLGPSGMYLASQGRGPIHMATQARAVYDVSGAGDTVIAATMLALAAGANPELAAYIANHAAGVVVAKVGTAPCTRDELLDSFASE